MGFDWTDGRAAGQMSDMYDYLFFDVEPGDPPCARAAVALPALLNEALEATHGELRGLFVSQLGWANSQAAALVAWPKDEDGRGTLLGGLAKDARLAAFRSDRLTPTVRPAVTDAPAPGGIYVHRWFHIRADAMSEFVALSTEGWVDFEARFDARIFGLFAAERSDEDMEAGLLRMLLITRYGDHGVWEVSRDPTSEAMKAFARRQALTRFTVAASTLLIRP